MTKGRSIFGRLALGAAGLLVFGAVPGENAQAQTPYWVADGPGSSRVCGMYFKSNPVGPGRYQATNVPSAGCSRLGYGNVYGWSRVGNSSVTLWDRSGRRMRTFNRMPGYPGYFRSGRLVFRPANTPWPAVGPGPGPACHQRTTTRRFPHIRGRTADPRCRIVTGPACHRRTTTRRFPHIRGRTADPRCRIVTGPACHRRTTTRRFPHLRGRTADPRCRR